MLLVQTGGRQGTVLHARMNYIDAVKRGFDVVNRNWQIVMIQMGVIFASFSGFLIIVGVPLAIAFIIFGLNLTEISHLGDILKSLHKPAEVFSKIFWVLVLVLSSLLFYILTIIALVVFVFGGSIGAITRSVKDKAACFRTKEFFEDGRRLFFPILGFSILVGLIFILVSFILGLFGGGIATIVSVAKEQEAALALFLGIFFSSILFVIGIILILSTLAVTVFGIAEVALHQSGPFRSLIIAARYLLGHIEAFYLYCIVFGAYVVMNFILFSLGFTVKTFPMMGPIFSVAYQFSIYAAQNYLGFVTIATIFGYYFLTTTSIASRTEEIPGTEEPVPTAEGSTPLRDTSAVQSPLQGDSPPAKDKSAEG
jgi:hypothetical protein